MFDDLKKLNYNFTHKIEISQAIISCYFFEKIYI